MGTPLLENLLDPVDGDTTAPR